MSTPEDANSPRAVCLDCGIRVGIRESGLVIFKRYAIFGVCAVCGHAARVCYYQGPVMGDRVIR